VSSSSASSSNQPTPILENTPEAADGATTGAIGSNDELPTVATSTKSSLLIEVLAPPLVVVEMKLRSSNVAICGSSTVLSVLGACSLLSAIVID